MQNWMFQRLNRIRMNLVLGIDAWIKIGSRHRWWEIDSRIITFSLHVFSPSFIPGGPHCHESQSLLRKFFNFEFCFEHHLFSILYLPKCVYRCILENRHSNPYKLRFLFCDRNIQDIQKHFVQELNRHFQRCPEQLTSDQTPQSSRAIQDFSGGCKDTKHWICCRIVHLILKLTFPNAWLLRCAFHQSHLYDHHAM